MRRPSDKTSLKDPAHTCSDSVPAFRLFNIQDTEVAVALNQYLAVRIGLDEGKNLAARTQRGEKVAS